LVSRPLVYLTLALASGIALWAMPLMPPWFLIMASLAVTAVAAVIFFALRKNAFPLLVMVFFLLGAALAAPDRVKTGRATDRFLGQAVTLEGYVCWEPRASGDRTVYELQVKGLPWGPRLPRCRAGCCCTCPAGWRTLATGIR